MTNFTQKHLKEFASTTKNTNLQIIGSLADGNPVSSSDPETLQSNARFSQGWQQIARENITNNTKNPAVGEMSALDYVHNYFLNHILQQGGQEYDDQREYYIGNLAKSGLKFYESLTDTNIGNPLTDISNWALKANLETNIVVVNSESDFGVFEDNKTYILNSDVTLSAGFTPFVLDGINVRLESSLVFGNRLFYEGGGTLFTLTNGATLELVNIQIFNSGAGIQTAKLIDTDLGSIFFHQNSQIFNFGTLGTIRDTIITIDVGYFNYLNSYSFEKRSDNANIPHPTRLANAFFRSFSTSPTGITLDFKDSNIADIFISGGATSGASETVFNFDPLLLSDSVNIAVHNFELASTPAAIFAPDSLDQKYVNSVFANNLRVPNSRTIAESHFNNNSQQTIISSAGIYVPIALNVNVTIEEVIERVVMQDLITFDNSLNTLNTTFSHGLNDDDRVSLTPSTYPATLPAELDGDTNYYVASAGATSFQLSLTQGGPSINFSDNGSGTNYYRHSTGFTRLLHFIYIGLEMLSLTPRQWLTIANSDGTNNDMSSAFMKIDTASNITLAREGATTTADAADPDFSYGTGVIELETGEGITSYVTNESNTDNIIVEKGDIILKQ